MKGMMTYRNLGNLSMNLEVSSLATFTPYKYIDNQVINHNNAVKSHNWHYHWAYLQPCV